MSAIQPSRKQEQWCEAIVVDAIANIDSSIGTANLSRRCACRSHYPNQLLTPANQLPDVDHEYRAKAEAGKLHQIAPLRFKRRKIGDRVIIFFCSDQQPEGQCTVIIETAGGNRGMRPGRKNEQ